MASLSLCMIVKNEEEFLEQCLNSVKDLVDEIIIVDTGSTDNTIEIAKKFGVKVIEIKWEDDFSKARNVSLKNATKDWILVLDADEVIAKKDHERIKEMISGNVEGYYLVQRTYTNDSSIANWKPVDDYEEKKDYSGFFETLLLRLFRNKDEIYYTMPVHESVKDSIAKYGGKTIVSTLPIHHYGKVRSKDFVDKKSEQYLKIGEKKAGSGDVKALKELAIQQQVLGKYDEAIVNFEKALAMQPNDSASYVNLGAVYFKKKEFTKAEDNFRKAIETNPNNPNAYYNLAVIMEKKDIKKAIELYNKSLSLNPKNSSIYFNVSKLFLMNKNIEKAIEMLEKVLDINPNDLNALMNIAVLNSRLKNYDKAMKYFAKAKTLDSKNPRLLLNIAVAYGVMEEYEKAVDMLKKAIDIDDNIPELYSNLAYTYHKMGKLDDAKKISRQIQQKFPGFLKMKKQ